MLLLYLYNHPFINSQDEGYNSCFIITSLQLTKAPLRVMNIHFKYVINYRDAFILLVVDGLTSWFAGCVIFVTLGYMSHQANVPIENVVSQGWFKYR